MRLATESYRSQVRRWPEVGRHILAQFDEESIVATRAYRPAIGHFAASQGYFGGEFRLDRTSWIKPNFLWMMYRSGWGTKAGQEVILAVRLQRSAFDEILAAAVPSSFASQLYPTRSAWQRAVKQSSVRQQWDPDHHPNGSKLERRAIQLGLRGEFLARYAKDWIIEIEDISEFVRQQYEFVRVGDWESLQTPTESVYPANSVDGIGEAV